ncbi:winged helix DNA-binding domain-containing protein [Streptomyces sp. NPDC058001]|uniref:winged helix DNA-binding domain-containing protein n=1 Tax=Streptomyces sp. NPDC058001 TaxID=3346300 RepID=UPI0036E04394
MTSRTPRTTPCTTPRTQSASRTPAPVLGPRALGRATLARQHLLRRTPLSARDAVEHLGGLQAQNVKPPYYALAARLDGFAPEHLSTLMRDREVVRIVTMRSTIHTHTAEDALRLRPFVQPARVRELAAFRSGLAGVDLDLLARISRELVEEEPRTMKQLREALITHWPHAAPEALAVAARCLLPLVQITPRGLWRESGQVTLTTAERWLGRAALPAPPAEDVVRRYLAAFGPASVKDMQTWAGVTRLRDTFERLRPELLTFRDENGVELFDLPDAPRPDPDTEAPPRLLPEFDNLLLSYADRSRLVPDAFKGRTWQGNRAYRVLLVDGLVAGVWNLEERRDGRAVLTVEEFAPLTRARRDAVTEEAARLLDVVTEPSTAYDIRFDTVVAPVAPRG